MTDQLRQAAQQALNALETLMIERESIYDKAIGALRTALEQQAAWRMGYEAAKAEQQAEPEQEQKYEKRIAPYSTTLSMLLNTTPPQRPWVGLTDGDWEWVADKKETSLDTFAHGAAWAVDQLKERNT